MKFRSSLLTWSSLSAAIFRGFSSSWSKISCAVFASMFGPIDLYAVHIQVKKERDFTRTSSNFTKRVQRNKEQQESLRDSIETERLMILEREPCLFVPLIPSTLDILYVLVYIFLCTLSLQPGSCLVVVPASFPPVSPALSPLSVHRVNKQRMSIH